MGAVQAERTSYVLCRRITAARPNNAVPTKNSRAPSGSAGRPGARSGLLVRMSTNVDTGVGLAVALTAREGEEVLPGSDSSESANPTGTMSAATIAASSKTR